MATDTILVPGNGTGTLSVQLHGPEVTDVEAVLAEIDTGGAGNTIATLTATSPTGLSVAAVPQGQPVAGGGQGRATWALRLAEEASAAPSPPGSSQYEAIRDSVGVLVPPNSPTFLPWFHAFGDTLLTPNGANQPSVLTAGTYAITAFGSAGPGAASFDIEGVFRIPRLGPTFQAFATSARWLAGLSSGDGPIIALTKQLAAFDSFDFKVRHNAAGNIRFFMGAAVAKLA